MTPTEPGSTRSTKWSDESALLLVVEKTYDCSAFIEWFGLINLSNVDVTDQLKTPHGLLVFRT